MLREGRTERRHPPEDGQRGADVHEPINEGVNDMVHGEEYYPPSLPLGGSTQRDSRYRVSSHERLLDWMLHPLVFKELNRRFGPMQVDLFASRLTSQLAHFVSWRPDPDAMATDTFSIDWTQFQLAYANPPLNLVG